MSETMEYDVIIVGAGPAGLSAAIHLKQLAAEKSQDISVCILEKGSEVGAHILSGAVIETRALDELLPNWQSLEAPLNTQAQTDEFYYLTNHSAIKLPTPKPMHNQGNYIISLANFCRWLADQAQQLGVDIFPGFAAVEFIYNKNKSIAGIITGEMGLDKQGKQTDRYQAGMPLHAKQVILAEGCRGSLSKKLISEYNLRKNSDPQSYAIGIKEIWQVSDAQHQLGKIIHTVGWPLAHSDYGGSFMYHLEDNQIAVGFVIGLDYKNPYLDPYEELQRFKTHPKIKSMLDGGERIAYGARALNEGGYQSVPHLTVPGALLIGDSAGFLNVPKIKGTHTAMKSGMLAAQAIINRQDYTKLIKASWLWQELYQVRNIRPGFKFGLIPGLAYAAFDTYILNGKAPWTFQIHADHKQTLPINKVDKINYPKHDNKLTFDKLSSVQLTNVAHNENQPCHLILKEPKDAVTINYKLYGSPETHYCPAGVYEIVEDARQQVHLQINASNCIHCKTCDIKDPSQNINWVPPEGGGGPNYSNM